MTPADRAKHGEVRMETTREADGFRTKVTLHLDPRFVYRAQFGHATDQEVQRAWDRLKEAMK